MEEETQKELEEVTDSANAQLLAPHYTGGPYCLLWGMNVCLITDVLKAEKLSFLL